MTPNGLFRSQLREVEWFFYYVNVKIVKKIYSLKGKTCYFWDSCIRNWCLKHQINIDSISHNLIMQVLGRFYWSKISFDKKALTALFIYIKVKLIKSVKKAKRIQIASLERIDSQH